MDGHVPTACAGGRDGGDGWPLREMHTPSRCGAVGCGRVYTTGAHVSATKGDGNQAIATVPSCWSDHEFALTRSRASEGRAERGKAKMDEGAIWTSGRVVGGAQHQNWHRKTVNRDCLLAPASGGGPPSLLLKEAGKHFLFLSLHHCQTATVCATNLDCGRARP